MKGCPLKCLWCSNPESQDFFPNLMIRNINCKGCGACVKACPEEAIVMSKDYELSFSSREEALYGKDKLLTPIKQLQDRINFLRRYK